MYRPVAVIDGSLRDDKAMNTPVRAAYSIPETMLALGVCRDAVYKLIREGKLPARRIGRRRTVVLATDLQAFLESLPRLDSKATA
jgi:excisionase family DNA binding protein